MEQLDEKFENDEFSDRSEQEQEEEHAEREISEKVDGLAEYQQNLSPFANKIQLLHKGFEKHECILSLQASCLRTSAATEERP